MNETIFDLLSQGMRYWFTALVAYILLRVIQSAFREFSRERRLQKQLHGGYSMGMLEIIEPHDNRKLHGKRYALRQESKIGRSSGCDICVNEKSVKKIQATIYQKNNQVFLSDYGTRAGVYLNGHRLQGDVALMDGDEIQLSKVLLLLHLKGGAMRASRERFDDGEEYSLRKPYRKGERQEDEWRDENAMGRYVLEEEYFNGYDEYDPEAYDAQEEDEYDPEEEETWH